MNGILLNTVLILLIIFIVATNIIFLFIDGFLKEAPHMFKVLKKSTFYYSGEPWCQATNNTFDHRCHEDLDKNSITIFTDDKTIQIGEGVYLWRPSFMSLINIYNTIWWCIYWYWISKNIDFNNLEEF